MSPILIALFIARHFLSGAYSRWRDYAASSFHPQRGLDHTACRHAPVDEDDISQYLSVASPLDYVEGTIFRVAQIFNHGLSIRNGERRQ
ncbi:hypothetical protein E4U13_000747 [Claviceps humidiphila]|uniref:Uncharacterized protein n=1 Tax=Claviceps humidiphila TaxID=1294629 RepID=A0A9P7TPT0_9HYPO|nr:hypothetical protein E4U13_000747 [Claviceps humidiphila]